MALYSNKITTNYYRIKKSRLIYHSAIIIVFINTEKYNIFVTYDERYIFFWNLKHGNLYDIVRTYLPILTRNATRINVNFSEPCKKLSDITFYS